MATALVNLTQTVAPTTEPVSVDEVKDHLRVRFDTDDTLLGLYIGAARQWAEAYTQRQLITATWRLELESFPSEILVPHPPLASVTSITYTDAAGASQTLGASIYQTDIVSTPGRIKPSYGNSWPATRSGVYGAVKLTYVAGYGAASSVPDDIKLALKQLVGHWYALREPVVIGTISTDIPFMFESALTRHRTFANEWACVGNAA